MRSNASMERSAPVTDARHLHQQFRVIDGVDSAVVAYPNAPLTVSALHFLAAWWPWIGCETFQARNDARDQLSR